MTDAPKPQSDVEEQHRIIVPPDDSEGRGDGILGAPVPAALRSALEHLVDADGIETLVDWVAVVRRHTGGGALDVSDLCHASEQTPHWGEVDGERYHFRCFYDAVVLAALRDESVAIRTESPDGAVIEAHSAGGRELSVSPSEAVFSIGVAGAVDVPPDGPSHEMIYAAVCPYVRAFPAPSAYDRWARSTSAPTVAMPLAGATALASALVE